MSKLHRLGVWVGWGVSKTSVFLKAFGKKPELNFSEHLAKRTESPHSKRISATVTTQVFLRERLELQQ